MEFWALQGWSGATNVSLCFNLGLETSVNQPSRDVDLAERAVIL